MDYSDINAEAIEYQEPQKDGRNAWKIYQRYNSKPLAFNLPRMRLPFGISRFDDTRATWNMELDITDEKVLKFLQEFDTATIAAMKKYKDIIWRKEKGDDEVEKSYLPLARQPNTNFNPRVRVKVAPWTEIDVVKNKVLLKDPGTLEDITKGSEATVHVQCAGTWCTPTQWGLTLRCKAMMLFPVERLSPFAHNFALEADATATDDLDQKVQY
jgi:hypothetical protein